MNDLRERIVDTALRLADQSSWEAVRLHAVAAELGITLDDVRGYFREKEDIVDAWFDRADQAMLRAASAPSLADLDTVTRLERIMMSWFDALADHRRPSRQMILGKLEFGHLHYQFTGAMRVSRTVQWMREAAGRTATLPWRAFEEAGLTSIYLMTFFYWMYDSSPQSERTRRFLHRKLERAARLRHLCGCGRPSPFNAKEQGISESQSTSAAADAPTQPVSTPDEQDAPALGAQ